MQSTVLEVALQACGRGTVSLALGYTPPEDLSAKKSLTPKCGDVAWISNRRYSARALNR